MTKSITKVCPICNSTFVPTNNRQKYCSTAECYRIVNNERAREYARQRRVKEAADNTRRANVLRNCGMDNMEISKRLNLRSDTIMRLIGPTPEGVGNGYNSAKDIPRKKKLTKGERLIPEMLKLREKNYTNAEISRLVGLCERSVRTNIGKQPEHISMATRIVAAQKRKLNAMRREIIAGNLANNIPCKTVAFVTMEAPSKTKKNNAGIAGNTAIIPALNKAI